MLRRDSQPVTKAMMYSFPNSQPSHSQTVGSNFDKPQTNSKIIKNEKNF